MCPLLEKSGELGGSRLVRRSQEVLHGCRESRGSAQENVCIALDLYLEFFLHNVFDAANRILDSFRLVRNEKGNRHVCHFRGAPTAKVGNNVGNI